ncbi:6-pyruvoyl tetrahydropterin synthase domain-containing protein [Phytophthora infestans]|uniref:6-pyruvoyltetrahydropterin synthase n=1 Tax=Phytophthora infestans TaxID=4787 RepID=A0A8S9UKN7_PHYIN|nr:6-pyruvoyl tetrahydropterin synthase domain-containing protein [Phytophthora infestans]
MLSVDQEQEQKKITEQEVLTGSPTPQSTTPECKRRRSSFAGSNMGKELSAEQKTIVKMYVTRDVGDGNIKCCYCAKEITSRNVDRWASHLRGCVKTPDDVKTQIQPLRNAASSPSASTNSNATAVRAGPQVVKTDVATNAVAAATSVPTTIPVVAPVPTPNPMGSDYNEVFKVHVSKDYMKFNAAHFIAYKGFREKLHGHNYRLAVTITGQVGPDGYVVDFGEIKKISRVICKDLNESFLVPMNSDALKISFDGTNVHILTEDMAKFSFPKADCSLLPIVHSSAEELAIYISNQLIDAFTLVALLDRGVRKIEVSISEANQQFASYERTILA